MSDQEAQTHHAGDEFEREPVPPAAQKGASAFWGMYAGEHTAGTEFMIGPLFVAWGASAFDLIVGLLLGNLMAVLTWRFLTAEIATQKRLTLYYQLEKITGRNLVTLYNFFNGVLFCFLAGAMVTVSATAVGVPFGDQVRMPTFDQSLAHGNRLVPDLRGHRRGHDLGGGEGLWRGGARRACGLALDVPGVCRLRPGDARRSWDRPICSSCSNPPRASASKVGFWGIVCFSWFCNSAMHLGMSDLSIFRFARKASHGWASAAGMFLGHYIAWICAALLLVYWVRHFGVDPSKGAMPGPMVYDAVGIAGLLCVVIAGWTTANPTLYRAGLAFQGMFPGMARVTGTIIAGTLCTVVSVFPAITMKLLDFVGIYGTILCPVGAVIVVNHFLAKRVGIPSDFAEKTGTTFNVAVLLAWAIPVAVGLTIGRMWGINTFMLPLPCWLACGVLYIVFAKMLNRQPVAGT